MAVKPKTRRGGLEPDKYLTDEELRRLLRYVRERGDLARVSVQKVSRTSHLPVSAYNNSKYTVIDSLPLRALR